MNITTKTPSCYGHLFDLKSENCHACLLNDQCEQAMNRPKSVSSALSTSNEKTDRRLLVLEVCSKFGIATMYRDRKTKKEVEITAENYTEFFNLDFLLTNKEALLKLLGR